MAKRMWMPHLITVMGVLVFGFSGLACASGPPTGAEVEAKTRKDITATANSASAELMNNLPKQGAIAVLGGDSSLNTTYAIEDIEYKLVNDGYKIVDRQRLDNIRSEQRLQLSGEVEEDTAVGIGKLAGAGTVIVVSINATPIMGWVEPGERRRSSGPDLGQILKANARQKTERITERGITGYSGHLTVTALDVQTGEIIAMARGDFKATSAQKKMTATAGSASAELMNNLSKQGAIAVLGGDSSPNDTYMIEDIEYNLVKGGYKAVDRQRLNNIRSEQQLQRSGEVADDTAVAIGRFAGAGAVIVVSMTTNRLTVKALDVQTGKILAIARRDF